MAEGWARQIGRWVKGEGCPAFAGYRSSTIKGLITHSSFPIARRSKSSFLARSLDET